MKVLKYLLWAILILVVLFVIFLIYSTIDNYNPPESEIVITNENAVVISDSVFSAVSWNIGYAGLDSTMDFFYDGGEKVRPEKEAVKRNIQGILQTVDRFRGTSFILLQEVDKNSKRSYKNDIYAMLCDQFSEYHSGFGKNYDVAFVPLPPSEPMGKVVSGLQTLSLPEPQKIERYSFPGNYSWPMSVFMLDRCFLKNTYPLANGKSLVMINTHNSAYDDGSLRQQQMDFLKGILQDEYEKGNYVIVGGDWNQCPSGFVPKFHDDIFDTDDLLYIEPGYPAADWTWAFDAEYPTNRRVMKPYKVGETPTTLIDYFLLSPNIELLDVSGFDLDFTYSDHQPVRINFRLN